MFCPLVVRCSLPWFEVCPCMVSGCPGRDCRSLLSTFHGLVYHWKCSIMAVFWKVIFRLMVLYLSTCKNVLERLSERFFDNMCIPFRILFSFDSRLMASHLSSLSCQNIVNRYADFAIFVILWCREWLEYRPSWNNVGKNVGKWPINGMVALLSDK